MQQIFLAYNIWKYHSFFQLIDSKSRILFPDCKKAITYPTGKMIPNQKVYAQNAMECLKECKQDSRCKFWDMNDRKCRLLSDQGQGPKTGFGGALGGKKECQLNVAYSRSGFDKNGFISDKPLCKNSLKYSYRSFIIFFSIIK